MTWFDWLCQDLVVSKTVKYLISQKINWNSQLKLNSGIRIIQYREVEGTHKDHGSSAPDWTILEEIQKCCKRQKLPATSSETAWSKSEIKKKPNCTLSIKKILLQPSYTHKVEVSLGILSELIILIKSYACLFCLEIWLITSTSLMHEGIIFPIAFNNGSGKATNLQLLHLPLWMRAF